jgi:hypothetical protein
MKLFWLKTVKNKNKKIMEDKQFKLPEDLLLEIQGLKDELTENVVRIGKLNVQKSFYEKDLKMIDSELNSLYEQAEILSKKEEDLQSKVVSLYGNGKLDFQTGIFTNE